MDNKKNEDLQSRREFFKSAAKSSLPILMLAAGMTPLLSSCEGDGGSVSCDCYGGCDGGCSNNCDGTCGGDCWAYCESKARS